MAQTTQISIKMLKKLLNNAADFNFFLDNISNFFMVLDPNYNLILINKNIQEYSMKLFNRKINIGENLLKIIPSLENDITNNLLDKIMKGEKVKVTKKAVINIDLNLWFEFTFFPVLNKNKQLDFIILTGDDLTILKNTEQKILINEATNDNLIYNLQQLICRFDYSGKILNINDEFCLFLGIPAINIIGSDFYSIFPEYVRDKVRSEISLLSEVSPQKSFIEIMLGAENKKK